MHKTLHARPKDDCATKCIIPARFKKEDSFIKHGVPFARLPANSSESNWQATEKLFGAQKMECPLTY